MTAPNRAVFLSYASQDAEPAARICAGLRAAGVEVWFDQSELRGGDAWDQRIRRQIRDCVLFIPIISEHTQARAEGYFRLEWDLADQRTHMVSRNKPFIVPVCIDRTPDIDADVPDTFLKVQWTRLPGGEPSASFSARIAALIGSNATTAQPNAPPMTTTAVPQNAPPRRWIAVAALGVMLAGALAWQLWRTVPTRASPAPVIPHSEVPVSRVPDKSIAVLPFVDMSEKRDQEYFSDGLSEELIDHLAHNPNLKVIARTSSFAFKGKSEDMRTIATKLGVANLLEGSVRKAGMELRITAQLIRASDGVHLWSQTYERKLTDIFRVQDEISTTVAKELNVALGEQSRPVVVGATSIAAYNLMLQGNYFYYRYGKGDIDKAITFYRQVIALEPRNALAWARIAGAYVELGREGQLSYERARSQAQAALQRALALDPDLPRAHYVLGNMHRVFDLGWDAAASEYERAVTLDARGEVAEDARVNRATIEAFKSGRVDALLPLATQGIVSNPLDAANFYLLGRIRYVAGRLEESAAAFRKLLELNPSYVGAHTYYAVTLLAMGKDIEALAEVEKESDELSKLTALPCIYWTMGRHAESDAAMKKLEDQYGNNGAYSAALNHACRAEVDLAFDWLERAYRQREGNLGTIKINPWLRSLHDDPRYKVLLRKLKLPES
jgi:TolB-like protein/cytochrome c-type biogenesis protein CcmH/NrfG